MNEYKKRELTITDLSGKVKARIDHLPNLKQFNFTIEEPAEFSEEEMFKMAIFILNKQTYFTPTDFDINQS